MLAAILALSSSRLRAVLGDWIGRSDLRLLLSAQAIALPYLAYAIPLGRFAPGDFVSLLAYVNLPLLVLLWERNRGVSFVLDFLALLLIWLPLELRWLPPLWSWPPGQPGRYLHGFLGVLVALFGFELIRSLPGIGFTLRCRARDGWIAAAAFAAFLPIGIVLGLATGFLGRFEWPESLPTAAARVAGIFLATALPEELLFRGLLQNLLRAWSGRPWLSMGLASLCFGAAHWNVGAAPDWRLPLLATLAGLAYGWAYETGRTLMAPALAHTFVNSFWLLLFRR
jgi:membrane protease YdiL (CAAX protease family)